jgi:hypothetical protein
MAATGVTHKSFFGETRSLGNVVFMEISFIQNKLVG